MRNLRAKFLLGGYFKVEQKYYANNERAFTLPRCRVDVEYGREKCDNAGQQ